MLDQTLVVGPFQCNCRLLACKETGDAVLIDPGDEGQRIVSWINQWKIDFKTTSGNPLNIKYLLHTHAHLDHIAGTKEVSEAFNAPPIFLHKSDEELYLNLPEQGKFFGMDLDAPLPVTSFFEDNQELNVGKSKFSVIHTPGHSPGSVCLRLHEDSEAQARETLFSGDTLFQGSIGRTDLWGGNHEQLIKNIKQRILTLDGDTLVCPGHGDDTSVGNEKHANPFLQ